MNNIFKKQNEKEMLILLFAQRYYYSKAKWFNYLYLFLVILIPISFNTVLYFVKEETTINILSLITIILLITTPLLFEYIQHLKRFAAGIQQEFDITLYNMDEHHISQEQYAEVINNFNSKNYTDLINWYEDTTKLSMDEAIFYCQCENLRWTRKLNKHYYLLLSILLFIYLLFVIIVLTANRDSFSRCISAILISSPLISFLITSYISAYKDNKKVNNLNNELVVIKTKQQNIIDYGNNLVALQEMLYDYRCNHTLIPNFIYKITKAKYSEIEHTLSKNISHNK